MAAQVAAEQERQRQAVLRLWRSEFRFGPPKLCFDRLPKHKQEA